MLLLCVAQVETQLNKTRDGKGNKSNASKDVSNNSDHSQQPFTPFQNRQLGEIPHRTADASQQFQRQHSIPEAPEYSPMAESNEPLMMPTTSTAPEIMTDPQMMNNLDLGLDSNFSWELIGLGLEEPLPMQEAIDELYGFTCLER